MFGNSQMLKGIILFILITSYFFFIFSYFKKEEIPTIQETESHQTEVIRTEPCKTEPCKPEPCIPEPCKPEPAKTMIKFFNCNNEEISPYLRSPLWWNNGNQNHGMVEDRSYLRYTASSINTDEFPKRIYFDLGVKEFDTSIGWIFKNYPCKFDLVYGFEADPNLRAALPSESFIQKYGDIFKIFIGTYVDTMDSEEDNGKIKHVNISKFIQDHSSKEDWVVVKMDIEGYEWKIIPEMIKYGTFDYIKEFFVELHYNSPEMVPYGWGTFKTTKEEAITLLKDLRNRGVCTHYWP